jgi:hypothetical protein
MAPSDGAMTLERRYQLLLVGSNLPSVDGRALIAKHAHISSVLFLSAQIMGPTTLDLTFVSSALKLAEIFEDAVPRNRIEADRVNDALNALLVRRGERRRTIL